MSLITDSALSFSFIQFGLFYQSFLLFVWCLYLLVLPGWWGPASSSWVINLTISDFITHSVSVCQILITCFFLLFLLKICVWLVFSSILPSLVKKFAESATLECRQDILNYDPILTSQSRYHSTQQNKHSHTDHLTLLWINAHLRVSWHIKLLLLWRSTH